MNAILEKIAADLRKGADGSDEQGKIDALIASVAARRIEELLHSDAEGLVE